MNHGPQPGRSMGMPDIRDPAGVVPPPLLQHIHLVSDLKLPHNYHPLGPEQALDLLLKAPHIVNDRPVSWKMLQAPADGTLMLCWQPLAHAGKGFATDGLIWASPESTFVQEARGYRMEYHISEAGFVPPSETVAAHRRMRFRLVSGPPNSNFTADPSLEIVHYTASFNNHRVQARQIAFTPQLHRAMNERRYLENSGVLGKKAFVLHDRNNWPRIAMPGMQNPNVQHRQDAQQALRQSAGPQGPGGQMAMQGPGGGPLGQPAGGRSASVHIPGPIPTSFIGEYLKEEDNHAYGDALDFVSPRDLSLMRYKQHHDWMEEVLSSPYAVNNIRPIKLNLQTSGELSWLTDGLWDSKDNKRDSNQNKDETVAATKPPRKTSQPISQNSVAELQKRADQYREKEEKEMEEMKKEHAEIMNSMAQQKLFADLERRLGDTSNDEELDEALNKAESATGGVIGRRQQILTVARGGMLKNGEEKMTSNTDDFDDYTTNMDTAGEALDYYDDQMEFTSADVAT